MLICQVAPLAGLVQVITGARGEGCPSAGAVAPHVATAAIAAATCRIRNILTSARPNLAHSQFPWPCQAQRTDFAIGPAGGARRPAGLPAKRSLAWAWAPIKAVIRLGIGTDRRDEARFPGGGAAAFMPA
jgi:hypothetical protein